MTEKERPIGGRVDGYRRLEGAQAEIRDAFFAAESGLFVLDCGPGAGKSVTADSIAAEDLARKARSGGDSPAETLCLTSFSRDDAASILPGVEAALRGFVEDPDAPVSLDKETAAELGTALRGSDRVGTIDSVLGSVFDAVAEEVGFDGTPEAGDSAALAQVHGDALEVVRETSALSEPLSTLDDAYPGGRYDADAADLLAAARSACRERRLSVGELRERLTAVVSGSYPDGPPDSLADVLRDTERFFGAEERAAVERGLDAAGEGNQEAIVGADRNCHDAWGEAVEALCTVLPAYLDAYDEACRRAGVVAHVDVAHWIATFFEEPAYESAFRERLRERWTGRLSTVIVDEAQDVSRAQHDALAPLIDAETRVLLVGDREQCIYAWRNAQPSLFAAAATEGRYFGVDWDTHERRTATRTYRSRPAVAAAIDTVFGPVFTDPTRDAIDDFTDGDEITEYDLLSAVRDPTPDPSVHVAAFPEHGRPGSPTWVDPTDGVGEAEALADCVATGLAEGRFVVEDGNEGGDADKPGVTVLFHRRTHMDTYVDAFADAGLSVRDTSRALFDHPLVGAVCAVVDWLQAPTSQSATLDLTNDDDLPITGLVDRLMRADWSISAVAESGAMRGAEADLVDGLADLAERRAEILAAAGADIVADVIETLSLTDDPLDQSATAVDVEGLRPSGSQTPSDDNSAVLDRLVGIVGDWEGEDSYSLAELSAALNHARRNPRGGPSLPTAAEADVTFRTIHGAKGDEDDVIAVADLGTGLGRYGAYLDQLIAHGSHVALAPPTNIDTGDDYPNLDGTVLANGPYDPDASPGDGDAGLRWASERWAEDEQPRIAGPPPLGPPVAAARAERWRLLYVALSRARDHLVIPLPDRRSAPTPRDRWVDTLCEAFDFDERRRGEYSIDTPGDHDPLTVAVNRLTEELTTAVESEGLGEGPPESPAVPDRGWTPRFVNPSTVYELAAAPEEGVLAHLSGQPLHADQDGVTVPLSFETMGPEVVGDVAHDLFTTALSAGVDAAALRECSGPLPAALDRAVDRHARGVAPEEREELRRYLSGTLCPQLADSAAYERLAESERRFVEEPLDAVVRIHGFAVEVGGRADVVSVDAGGDWHVDELKIGLRPPEPELQERYELQAATYAWLLERQGPTDVTAAVTTVGAHQESQTVEAGQEEVQELLDRLAERRWNGEP
ncbi:UvrD-helicase domain-containing protein [Halolamina salifodinae]|uniref:DNA 3'-5' helicase n=1 Tax=Halolamina salifodinae TaxID=1202767 RepID=A0A8T4GVQ1_9EURY|nr:UvrD-helicase domain-containing protein [Halolamina salifodinae]MBP1987191.1 ATP-dependent helicase/nuclease subunit A [Halolamina salifodinae]